MYPAVKLFRNGQHAYRRPALGLMQFAGGVVSSYEGPPTAGALMAWLRKETGSKSVLIAELAQLNQLLEAR